ncbi:2-oxo-4-hydroxy-4-carboxy-5-ureidoimidazoline decarboxylase [Halopseudomonas laoshanensis]|uniref:2-oxo-4-hydroxy-4-carboxy-5-ureidoimidazoline decarboxylase n=1 Tax=Halopseudomonas laoshanensis TaxID=2268758 RepID=A0A7V7KX64_9GAMM|nr:2-oxo-4-hydroxy-4-carboxy-5-ureidoimidazoline decarboxylase [Halopseudomonas laoshanensis]KAA0694137.1 2-oxo-4-hydroxy-4-carboxy-5-ureidoimidazoline decarboxylase [Halopseudomonas laoshanensis]
MTLEQFNQMPEAEAETLMRDCCAAEAWVRGMVGARPFASPEALHGSARALWPSLMESDWLAAFEAHPKIGDIKSLKARYASTEAMASGEQAGARVASEAVLHRLKEGNDAYYAKFGFIFIVCATGKSAEQMLELLEARLPNERAEEIRIAAAEQAKITHIRLDKLL